MAPKRTRDGAIKAQTTSTPPTGAADDSKRTTEPASASRGAQKQLQHSPKKTRSSSEQRPASHHSTSTQLQPESDAIPSTRAAPPSNPPSTRHDKLPRLPSHFTISKRPLHHPSLSSPFSSASSPKVIYLTHASPFIPAVKRVRKLLGEIAKRSAQGQRQRDHASSRRGAGHVRGARSGRSVLAPTGTLAAGDVERHLATSVSASASASRGVVAGSDSRRGAHAGSGRGIDGAAVAGAGGEPVYVKATGRAIESALSLGVYFQGESDCWVRVEMGSVRAVDDVLLPRQRIGEAQSNGDQGGRGHGLGDEDSEIADRAEAEVEESLGKHGEEPTNDEPLNGSAVDGKKKGSRKKTKAKQGNEMDDADVPETRIRTLSSITVTVGLLQ